MKNNFVLGVLLRDIETLNKFSFFLNLKREAKKKGIKVIPITAKSRVISFDVVYDGFFSNNKKESYEMRNFIKNCKEAKKPVFNSRRFTTLTVSKWDTYRLLLNNRKLKGNLPQTFLLKDFKLFENFLEKKGEVILKLNIGQEGKDIFLVKKIKDKIFLTFFQKSQKKEVIIKKTEKIKKFLKKWPEKRYIFQEKIDVPEHKGRVFDVRALLFRFKRGWKIFLIGARVAPPGSFLSNISKGGEWKTGKSFYLILKNIFPENFQRIIKRIQELSIETANFLEEMISDNIFEMGIDFVLDKKGKIWIIEVNSKPGKKFFEKSSKKFLKKAPLLLVNFAKNIYTKK